MRSANDEKKSDKLLNQGNGLTSTWSHETKWRKAQPISAWSLVIRACWGFRFILGASGSHVHWRCRMSWAVQRPHATPNDSSLFLYLLIYSILFIYYLLFLCFFFSSYFEGFSCALKNWASWSPRNVLCWSSAWGWDFDRVLLFKKTNYMSRQPSHCPVRFAMASVLRNWLGYPRWAAARSKICGDLYEIMQVLDQPWPKIKMGSVWSNISHQRFTSTCYYTSYNYTLYRLYTTILSTSFYFLEILLILLILHDKKVKDFLLYLSALVWNAL